jgi:hypothetical protein
MNKLWSCLALGVLSLAAPVGADDVRTVEAKSFQVPYRLTVPKHILVRAKINGKGPFNFILDTGAPALFVSTKVASKLGVKKDAKGWGTFDRFEIEGGVVVADARGRIEDPFQLEGMNGLGLAGAELHGVIGYNILARYRMEIDFTSDKMVWTPLKWTPEAPKGLDGGKASGGGSLEMVGSLMKMLGSFMGAKTTPEVVLRGFFGIQLVEKDDDIIVHGILDKGPAADSGLQAGDRLTKFQGRTVINIEDVQRLAKKLSPGETVKLTVQRGDATREISFKTGEGL